jgi:hypothetical protein
VIVSSGRGRFCWRLFPQRMAAWSLVSFALFVGTGVGSSAEPSGPSLTIDYDRLPVVAFEAKNIPLIQVLNQLAAALHIEVNYAIPVDKSPAISGSFKGDVNDILRRVLLPNAGYVIWYRGSAIDRILVTSSGAAAIAAAAASSPDAAEVAQAFDELPTARPATVAASGPAGRAQRRANPLSNLLQAQANVMQQSVANAGPADGSDPPLSAVASPRSIPQSSPSLVGGAQASMAAMTGTAQANVQMLVKALNAVCIGASCAQ